MDAIDELTDALAQIQSSKEKLTRAGFEVVRSEKQKIILPKKMSLTRAIANLTLLKDEEETVTDVDYTFDCFPYEGALGLVEVLADKYGNALSKATQIKSFFGTEDRPPKIMQLEVGPGVFKQIIWGSFAIQPIKGGTFETGYDQRNGSIVFKLTGSLKAKHKKVIDEIADALRIWLKTKSPFRGQALTIQVDSDGMMTPEYPPKIMDTAGFNESDLILPPEISEQIKAMLFNPVKNTDYFKSKGIPINRGTLLVGQYGTGKTLTAKILSGICVKNKWTYVYVEDPELLIKSIEFARKYTPAVVFCEDVDLFLSERNGVANAIINEIDGLTSKSAEVMIVLTTNNPENIHKSLLRQGRMDLVLKFPLPDKDVTERLIRKFAGIALSSSADISEAIAVLERQIPASIAEAVQRAKMMAISLRHTDVFTPKDLTNAAKSLSEHLKLLEEPARTTAELAIAQVRDVHIAMFKDNPVQFLDGRRKNPQVLTASDG